jgi:pimeloyl-ACP methyl ester carboxylesterase
MTEPNRPVDQPTLEVLQVGALRMRVATQGSGPLVLLCHGFPESWHSWRHQLAALAAAGYRAVAPDMRGYGGTDAPADPDQYTMLHLLGDMVSLVTALGERQAVIVGHDWGAPVAWNCALLRLDLFRAVVGMSVPYSPPTGIDLLSALEKAGIGTFYMQYFQTPGVAEAELEHDVTATIRRLTFSMSGDGPGNVVAGILPKGAGFLDATVEPAQLPDWMPAGDIAYVAGEFERTGFRGGLNWYPSFRRTAELMGALAWLQDRATFAFRRGLARRRAPFPGREGAVAATAIAAD